MSEVSEPFVTSQKAVVFFLQQTQNTHTHMQREVELNDVPETFKLLSSFSFPQGILWLCCNACCHFFYYPKLTVLWHFLETKPFPTSFVYFLALSRTGRGCDGPLLPWSGSPSPWLARPAVRVCVGGRPASGGTHNSHTRVFLPSQLSRAVIAGLSSDEWLLFSPPDCNRLASRTV